MGCAGALRLHMAKELDLLDKNQYNFLLGNRVPPLSGPMKRTASWQCITHLPCRWKKTGIRSTAIRCSPLAHIRHCIKTVPSLAGGSTSVSTRNDIQENVRRYLDCKERAISSVLLNAFVTAYATRRTGLWSGSYGMHMVHADTIP